MPLQNRVKPDGEIVAVSARGSVMGNRGGRLHSNEARELLPKRWANKQWIVCVTEFKGRQRQLMAPNRYTELFFLDEVTALAAGHRPCFECRRTAAKSYQQAWHKASGEFLKAGEMDKQLHLERLEKRQPKQHQIKRDHLPASAVFSYNENFYAIAQGNSEKHVLKWSFQGYAYAGKLEVFPLELTVLTPPSTLATLENGYKPQWHESAKQFS